MTPRSRILGAAAGASLLVVAGVVVVWLVFGSALSACCIAMYGDAANPCSAKGGKPMSASEQEENRKKWMAGLNESRQRCTVRIDDLLAGTVFVADPERSPRGKELLAQECAPFSAAQLARFKDPVYPPPLQTTNPALCDQLAKGMGPEAFSLRRKGGALYFYYFTYEEAGGQLRMKDVYSKIAMDLSSLRSNLPPPAPGAPPPIDPDCPLRPVAGARDLGSAILFGPWAQTCFQALYLESEDPERARFGLCHGAATFRRSPERLEATSDGG